MVRKLQDRSPAGAYPLTEKQFAQQVVDYARLCSWLVYRTWISIHSPAGFPDLVLARSEPRGLIFAELKSEAGKVSAAQQEWLEVLAHITDRLPWVEVYLWRPSDFDDIVRILR